MTPRHYNPDLDEGVSTATLCSELESPPGEIRLLRGADIEAVWTDGWKRLIDCLVNSTITALDDYTVLSALDEEPVIVHEHLGEYTLFFHKDIAARLCHAVQRQIS